MSDTMKIHVEIENRAIHTKHGQEITFRATGDGVRLRFLDSPFQAKDGVEEIITLKPGGKKTLKVKKPDDPKGSRVHYFSVEAAFGSDALAAVPCVIVNGGGGKKKEG